jgi:hypothetical protein
MAANIFKETDEPHSESGHNPFWCGGDAGGHCHGDDPCWPCIQWLHAYAIEKRYGVDKAGKVVNAS